MLKTLFRTIRIALAGTFLLSAPKTWAAEIVDIRYGATEDVARIELVLSEPASVRRRPDAGTGASFIIEALNSGPFRYDPVAGPIDGFELSPTSGGVELKISALVEDAALIEDGARLIFDVQAVRRQVAAPPKASPVELVAEAPLGAVGEAPKPMDGAMVDRDTSAGLRLPRAASLKPARPIAATDPEPPAAASATSAPPPQPMASVAAQATQILGAELSPAACDAAKESVTADAWDMDALVDYGLCLASNDQLEQSETVFKRLLTFDPSSYRALVGRAINAEARGDRVAAGNHYRSALAAQPPDNTAEQIQGALKRLGL